MEKFSSEAHQLSVQQDGSNTISQLTVNNNDTQIGGHNNTGNTEWEMREAVPPKLHELNVLLPRTVLFENPSIDKRGHTNQYRVAWLQGDGKVANRLYLRAFSAETDSTILLSPFIVMGNVDIRRNRSKKSNKGYYDLHVDYYDQTCSDMCIAHSNMLQRLAASAKVNVAPRPVVWASNNGSIKVTVRIHE
jgi:hypothetical protein